MIGLVSYLVVSSAPASNASSVVQQTGTVKRGVVLSSVSATGSVAAAKDLTLNFQSSGTLTHVDVKAGQHVTRGDVTEHLAELKFDGFILDIEDQKAKTIACKVKQG